MEFLLDQCLSFSDPMVTGTTGFCAGLHQPYEQVLPTGSIEVSAHGNQDSINVNNLQILDSSMSKVVHDHKSKMNYAQSNIMAKTSCKRRRKQKKSNDDQENKKMIDSKEGGQIGYIHVRARRGEATDSHSLAERVRREKISEKMKALQSIVPGCDKARKAHMLDAVINYVQSLQNEIQILSLKLASVNPSMLYDYGAEYEKCILKPLDQNMTTIQQQLISFQEHQMPCMISQDNGEELWDLEEQRHELDDHFAIINCNSFC
ncbi:hypothetical protein L1987_07334 [Smallanthus sonchifolius]|uniref:Uncharacterized protein n=1 Tax=Smallanthus sonchifolius TaxID=185202 RepID=A0ACB9K091_9ASTR|nr:hypothetical protein L1987_07334 [Smallanthus sonchifolius]